MKRIITGALLAATILAGSACTKIDNYGGPNASLEGRFIDAGSKSNFLTSQNSIQVRLEQLSWSETPAPQDIPSKMDGTYKDSKLFRGHYRVTPMGGAFWPVLPAEIDIDRDTKFDFELTPYLVIRNFTHVLNGTELTLDFDIEAPIETGLPTIIEAQPYVNTTKMVGAGASIREFSEARMKVINKEWADMSGADKHITLTVPNLVPGRIFYVRVGVRFNDSYKSSNFSEIVEISVPK